MILEICEKTGLKFTDYRTHFGTLTLWFNKFMSNNLGLNFAPTSYFLYALRRLLNSFKPRFPTNEVRHLEEVIQSLYRLCSLPDNLRIWICWVLVMTSQILRAGRELKYQILLKLLPKHRWLEPNANSLSLWFFITNNSG